MAGSLLSWERLPALLAVGAVASDQVPDAAAIALEAGLDSPLLRRLADPLFEDPLARPVPALAKELNRLGLSLPSAASAVEQLARSVAAEIAQGKIEPLSAAHLLAGLSKTTFGQSEILDPFVYADSEFEGRPAEKDLFESMVRAAAASLIGET